VQRLTMQRRIFSIADRPFIVRRGGAPFETHGTLMALIADHPATVRGRRADTSMLPPPSIPARVEPEGTRLAAEPSPAQPVQSSAVDGARERQRRRNAEPNSQPSAQAAATREALAPAAEDESQADISPTRIGGSGANVISRRRAGQRPPPRWMTAGKARRGRLKE
jgi:hypothetical protein